jgi:beta-glucosidase
VGYRWTDKQKVRPLFAFGHGLSYTTFKLGKPTLNSPTSFTVSVTNTGNMAGSETIQLYISDKHASVDRPVKELKAFQKVFLQPGETRDVRLTIGREALSFYDEASSQWKAEPGKFEALIGTASDQISGRCEFELK